MYFLLSTSIFFTFLFSQDVLHEDFTVTIGEKIYSPISDKPFEGKIIKFFPFEQIQYQYYVIAGVKDGKYTSYFKGGNIFEKGNYKNGLKDGLWLKFDQYYNRDRKIAHLEKQLVTKSKENERMIMKLTENLPTIIRKVVGHIEFARPLDKK